MEELKALFSTNTVSATVAKKLLPDINLPWRPTLSISSNRDAHFTWKVVVKPLKILPDST